MTDYVREQKLKKKREYYQDWRKKHPESVAAANARYWAKKAQEMRSEALPSDIETREENNQKMEGDLVS